MSAPPKKQLGDLFGDAARKVVQQRSGRIPGAPPAQELPGSADEAQQAPVEPVAPPGGFAGGVQAPVVPEGESFDAEVRRRVFG